MPPTETAPTEVKPTEVTPKAETPPVDPNAKHPLLPELMKSLLDDVPAEAKPGEKKEEPKKEPEAKKEPEPKKEAEKPIARRVKVETRPALPIEPARTAEPARAAAEPAKPEVTDDSDLEEEERQMIADAAEAEKLFPDKHKGLGSKARAYVRAHIKFINDHGGDANFDPSNPEYAEDYQRFLSANQPHLSPAQQREINETRIANQVTEKTRPELDRIKDERYADREEPIVRQTAGAAYNKLALASTPKEILDDVRARGFAVSSKDYKLELDTIHAVITAAVADAAELDRLTRINPETKRPLVAVALDPADPKFGLHQRLSYAVHEICEDFKNNGAPAEQRRGNKWFVTKEEWNDIKAKNPAGLASFWTFSNKEIIERMLDKVPATVKLAIEKKVRAQEELGFIRKPREQKKEEVKPPVKGAPPAPHPSPAPGAGPAGEVKSDGARLASILSNV